MTSATAAIARKRASESTRSPFRSRVSEQRARPLSQLVDLTLLLFERLLRLLVGQMGEARRRHPVQVFERWPARLHKG